MRHSDWAVGLLCIAACAMRLEAAAAQAYPIKPTRLIVGVQPGGNLDTVGRAVAQGLTDSFGRRAIVENRPGGNARSTSPHS
jgi:tripartite-type tricarboxylate transporter receptor subunit TctC